MLAFVCAFLEETVFDEIEDFALRWAVKVNIGQESFKTWLRQSFEVESCLSCARFLRCLVLRMEILVVSKVRPGTIIVELSQVAREVVSVI